VNANIINKKKNLGRRQTIDTAQARQYQTALKQ
jgi:hypothetical protein